MSLRVNTYQRDAAVDYASKWALKRNPKYLDFENLGGDCTNFASQAIFAGSNIMNYTETLGWYYINSNQRSPSWTGVNFLYDFLIKNNGIGPFAKLIETSQIELGDIIQLSFYDPYVFNHSLVVVKVGNPPKLDNICVCAHSDDQLCYPLTNYSFIGIRFIHIEGVRVL